MKGLMECSFAFYNVTVLLEIISGIALVK